MYTYNRYVHTCSPVHSAANMGTVTSMVMFVFFWCKTVSEKTPEKKRSIDVGHGTASTHMRPGSARLWQRKGPLWVTGMTPLWLLPGGLLHVCFSL